MSAFARIKKEPLAEIDNIVAESSNIFNNASIRFAEGKYKVGALSFAAIGLITMQTGFAMTMLELSKDGSLVTPFSDMLNADYLPQLLTGGRELVGEYVTAAGLGLAGLSAPLAALATKVTSALHSMASDPLTKIYNMIGNELSEDFKQRNINQIVNGVVLYYDELAKNTPHDQALLLAWEKIDNTLIQAKGMSTDKIAGDVIAGMNVRLNQISSNNDEIENLDYGDANYMMLRP